MDKQQQVQDIFMKLSMEHFREFISGSILFSTKPYTVIRSMELCEEEVSRKVYQAATEANLPLNDLKAIRPIISKIANDVVGDYCESEPERDAGWYNDE